ncbi:MAG: hypothetical protein IPJ74_01005 [Saprospiraceae bacterium]|nr:hypothetical protein [Saprospiraceae bacterium]
MLKFFRNIRRRLLGSGKVKSYALYAIGEILLVVIGILIALQINAWNQDRLNRKEERIILSNLHEEFLRHKKLWLEIEPKLQLSSDADLQLMNLCGTANNTISMLYIDTLLSNSLIFPPFNSPQPILEELNSSGKLKLIRDEQLKQDLFKWLAQLKWVNLDNDLIHNWVHERLHPYLINRVSYKNMDVAGGSSLLRERSRLTKDYTSIFQDLEFENIMDNKSFFQIRMQSYFKELGQIIDKIIQETEPK